MYPFTINRTNVLVEENYLELVWEEYCSMKKKLLFRMTKLNTKYLQFFTHLVLQSRFGDTPLNF